MTETSKNLSPNEYAIKTDYRTPKVKALHWRGQVQNLRRIAVRATSKAAWFRKLAEGLEEHKIAKDWQQRAADLRADAILLDRKAASVAEQMVAIAKANGDPRAANL